LTRILEKKRRKIMVDDSERTLMMVMVLVIEGQRERIDALKFRLAKGFW
jgi:hypothetical protein